MLYIKETTGSVQAVSEKLMAVAANHGMEVVGTHNISEKLGAAGLALPRDCRVLEVCNPQRANGRWN